ncbi:MAG: hypothetical protein H0S84_07190 [Bacteroidales bacterium]|nr:hypothetical protein [Bacteroidales bacterium]
MPRPQPQKFIKPGGVDLKMEQDWVLCVFARCAIWWVWEMRMRLEVFVGQM